MRVCHAFRSLAAVAASFEATSSPAPPPFAASAAAGPSDDPFQWLEDITGAKSVAWVQGQNAKTRAVLESDPRYETFRQEALTIFTAQDRIAEPRFRGGEIDNFWQDATHKRGEWRRATVDSYRSADPQWETLLDIDALAAAEHQDWYWKGATCLEPEERYCLVHLSDGGKDAVTIREFDTRTKTFVQGGFALAREQTERSVARQGHAAGRPRLGPGHDD